jgi:hypothetical protein
MVHQLSNPDTVRILLVVCRYYSYFRENNPYGISYEDSTGLVVNDTYRSPKLVS